MKKSELISLSCKGYKRQKRNKASYQKIQNKKYNLIEQGEKKPWQDHINLIFNHKGENFEIN